MERIGPYEPSKELGRGGMGVVLRARCTRTGREVALKLLRAATAQDADVARFEREVQALVSLRHPSIVAVLDAGTSPRGPWVAMELVEGESLQARLRRDGPLAPEEARALARTLCGALEHAHAMGVLHRDVKPANVLLAADGRVVLVDFGLARVLGRESRLTLTGEVLGTPCYMAPEQANGQPCGPQADVYGVGATLYEALTGRPPLRGTSVIELLHQVLTVAPARPEALRPGLPAALSDVVMRCLEKEPARRPEGAAALADALERASTAPLRARARGRLLAAAVALLGLALAGASVLHARGAARALDEVTRGADALDVPALLMRGRAQVRSGDKAGGLASAEAGLGLEPGSAPLLGLRAGALFQLGRREEALADCRRLVELGSNEGEALVNGAAVAVSCDEFELAVDLLGPLARADPRHVKARHLLLLSLLGAERRVEAAAYVERALVDDALDPEEAVSALEVLVKVEPALATAACERALARWPDEERLHLLHVAALEKGGDRARTLRAWSELLDRWPDDLGARRGRAQLRLSLRDVPGALEDAERVVEAAPDRAASWELLATVRERQGEWSAAHEALSRAIDLRPGVAKLYVRRGELHQRLGRGQGAFIDLTLAIALDPRNGPALTVRGTYALHAELLPLARVDLERAAEVDPEQVLVWVNLASVRGRTGDHPAALAACDRAQALAPERYEVFAVRGEVLMGAGRPADARREYTRALELARDPQDQRVLREALERTGP